MSKFNELIGAMKAAAPAEKQQLLQYLMHNLEKLPKSRLTAEDREALLGYAMDEVDSLLVQIPATPDYRTKDALFTCEDFVFGLVMYLCPNAEALPAGGKDKLQFLMALVQTARILENTLDKLFEQDSIGGDGAEKLASMVEKIPDEYRRGKLWAGLIHYREQFSKLTDGAKAVFSALLGRELERYLSMAERSGDILENLELMADLCADLPCADTRRQLLQLLELGRGNIAYFAASSVLALKQELPQSAVEALARDLGYANMTHALLNRHGLASRFPAECATEEYLAKSDLVHWLLYPTELGQEPDEIEYIGKATWLLKRDVYHIFRFRSDSATLSDDCRGRWLIGWSNADGGTFSNFDLYDTYAKATPEATVKNIKKKLIG